METIEYTLIRIDGDYAVLEQIDNPGQTILVARALLPEAADEGSRLLYEMLSYSLIEE